MYYSEIIPSRIKEAETLFVKHINSEYKIAGNIITIFEMYNDEPDEWDKLLTDNKLYQHQKKDGYDDYGFKLEEDNQQLRWIISTNDKEVLTVPKLYKLLMTDKTTNLQCQKVFKYSWKRIDCLPIQNIVQLDDLFHTQNNIGFRDLDPIALGNMINYINKNYIFEYKYRGDGTFNSFATKR